MNMTLMKTSAEQALSHHFEAVQAALPGTAGVAAARREAFSRVGRLGLPHRRIEEWKYTDLRAGLKLAHAPAVGDATAATRAQLAAAMGHFADIDAPRAVFVNGAWRKDLSSATFGPGVKVAPLGRELASRGNGVAENLARINLAEPDAVLSLNTAFMTDGAVIKVAAGTQVEKPLLLVFARAGAAPLATATRNRIDIAAGASIAIIEIFISLDGAAIEGQSNAATELTVGNAGVVAHVQCAFGAGRTTLLSNWIVNIGGRATYRAFQLTAGAALARNQLLAKLEGQHSKLDISGVMLGRGNDHIDTTLLVDHIEPHCESRELFKTVLDDRARAVFQGKVIVRQKAQKSDGKQMARALMLSPDTEFDSKPELEIYADDVVCGHGSTCAEIDPDLIFYCRSRGISEAQARALLIDSFVGEAIEKVDHAGVRQALVSVASDWLAQRQPGN